MSAQELRYRTSTGPMTQLGRQDSFSSTSSAGSARDFASHTKRSGTFGDYGSALHRSSARMSLHGEHPSRRMSLRASLGNSRRKPMVIQYYCGSEQDSVRESSRVGGSSFVNVGTVSSSTTTPPAAPAARRSTLSLAMVMNAPTYKGRKYDVEWQKDHEVHKCQVCSAAFSKLSRRKHHCRMCGEIICGDCSPDQVVFVGKYIGPKRACVVCFALLETMMLCGDPRVTMSKRLQSPIYRELQYQQQKVEHDRFAELERVLAAARLAKRHENRTVREMNVISARWLQTWLAFARLDELSDDDLNLLATVLGLPLSKDNLSFCESPPRGIENLVLLELSKGTLVKQDKLIYQQHYYVIPKEVWDVLYRWYGGGPIIRVALEKAQLIRAGDTYCPFSTCEWGVDFSSLLSFPLAGTDMSARIESILSERHEHSVKLARSCSTPSSSSAFSVEEAMTLSNRSAYYPELASSSHSGSTPTELTTKHLDVKERYDQPRKSPSQVDSRASRAESLRRTSVPLKSPNGNADPNDPANSNVPTDWEGEKPVVTRGRRRSVSSSEVEAAQKRAAQRAHSTQKSLVEKDSISIDPQRRGSHGYDPSKTDSDPDSDAPRRQSTAQAVSAFALAMKQARLNAQKAINDVSRFRSNTLGQVELSEAEEKKGSPASHPSK